MSLHRWSVAAAAVALLATAPDADAGKGKMGRSARIERTGDGQVVFREKVKHTKGIRARLTGRKLGAVMSVETAQSGGQQMTTVQRRRQRVNRVTESGPGGTSTVSQSAMQKKGILTRKWRTKMTREDTVRTSSVDEVSSRNRVFGGQSVVERRTGEMDNSRVTELKIGRNGEVKSERTRVGSRTGTAYAKKLKGKRSIENTHTGMEVVDTQTRRWGVMSRLTGGRLGKKVTVEQRQSDSGTSISMTAPRHEFRRETTVGDGWTESTSTVSKKNRVFGRTMRVRERDKVTSDENGVVRRVESLRRDGTVKKVVTERVFADGRSRKTTQRVRRDGTVSSVSEKETIERADGKRDVRRVRSSVRRDGSVRFSVGRSKVDGKRSAFVKTPVGTLGTPTGRITSSPRRNAGDDE